MFHCPAEAGRKAVGEVLLGVRIAGSDPRLRVIRRYGVWSIEEGGFRRGVFSDS